jgi:hypothetical protein
MKQAKKAKSNVFEFSKHLSGVIVALSLLSMGAYAAYLGHYKTRLVIYAGALLFGGAINALVGLVALYRTLMHAA